MVTPQAMATPVTDPAPLGALAPGDAPEQMALWLMAAALALETWVTRAFPDLAARHSCLSAYRAAAQTRAPELSPQAWPAQLMLAERLTPAETPLPFTRSSHALGLTATHRLAFALAALAEEDPRISALLSELQGSPSPGPTADTMAQSLTGPAPALGAGADLLRPLLDAGLLIETEPAAPRSRCGFAPAPLVWDLARGAASPSWPKGARLRARATAAKLDDLVYRQTFRDRLARVPAAIANSPAPIIVLRHMPGADAEDIAAALARAMGADLLICPQDDNAQTPLSAAALLTGAIRFRALTLAPGQSWDDTHNPPDGTGPLILSLGRSGGLAPHMAERAVTLDIPFPGAQERARAWRQGFAEHPVEDLTTIRDRFQLPLGHIRRAAKSAKGAAALAGRSTITPDDARTAIRALGREELDTLADFLSAREDWTGLIVPDQTRHLLTQFATRCSHRETLSDHGTRTTADRGVRALFSGPSGTGKTLAAQLLGGEIGTDVYRVNLSAVVDKYVGETEKRLDQLLSRAEALDVILLLDEGDGLMAQRTDVRSANDRFANLETNFLLQRLESHAGIVVVTTNMPDQIDPAFQRRMDIVVPFPRPMADMRLALFDLHLPEGHQVAAAALRDLAVRAPLTGGQIRNAVRTALSLALAEHHPLDAAALRRGIDLELQKAGAMAGTAPRQTDAQSPPRMDLSAFGALLKGDRA